MDYIADADIETLHAWRDILSVTFVGAGESDMYTSGDGLLAYHVACLTLGGERMQWDSARGFAVTNHNLLYRLTVQRRDGVVHYVIGWHRVDGAARAYVLGTSGQMYVGSYAPEMGRQPHWDAGAHYASSFRAVDRVVGRVNDLRRGGA